MWATTWKSFQSNKSFISSEERRVPLSLLARSTALRRRPRKWFPWTIVLATCWSRPTIVSRVLCLKRRPLVSRRSLMLAIHAENMLVGRLISKRWVSIIQPRTTNLSANCLVNGEDFVSSRDSPPSGSSGCPRTSSASRAAWALRSPGESPSSCGTAEKVLSKNTSVMPNLSASGSTIKE